MALSKKERLDLFYEQLRTAPPASSAEGALKLINIVLDAVEDQHSGIPRDPAAHESLATDGRMYGPHESFEVKWEGKPRLKRYAQIGHETFIQDNGAILIRARKTKVVVFQKAGQNGEEIEL